MTSTRGEGTASIAAGVLTGLAGGIATAAGTALLLATGEGLLAALGLLAGLTLAAFAVGLWAGAPEDRAGAGRRWVLAVLALLVAAFFGQFWLAASDLRTSGPARALATLLLVAGPAYATGSVVAMLRRRPPRWSAEPAAGRALALAVLLGAAVGLTAAGALIPRFDPGPVFFAAAVALGVAAAVETRGEPMTDEERSRAMRDRVVIVTGVGARGQVGYAVAEAFLTAGARVVVTDLSDAVDALARELATTAGGGGERVVAVRADLTRSDGAEAVVAEARERFGRLDGLVNVAGGLTVIKPLSDTSEEEWTRELDRNGRTAFLMSRAALPLLRETGGAIVNFASPAG
ncbi:MAG: SDR family NAD(P)-dependent oxidoreductase, partial [Gemmatimonadota bacterium]